MKENLIGNITLGVVSGIFTSVILYIWYFLYKKGINPWWENRLYKGVVLEGVWAGKKVSHYKLKKGENETIHDELSIQMNLQQSGYSIKGIFSAESVYLSGKNNNTYSNLYNIKGHIHDNYVVLEYHPISRKRTGLGTFIMEVKNGGKMLQGNVTFVEEEDMRIVTFEGATLYRESKD